MFNLQLSIYRPEIGMKISFLVALPMANVTQSAVSLSSTKQVIETGVSAEDTEEHNEEDCTFISSE